ncbi:dihydrolipoamide acetyltransferase [Actinoplanes ianthinogenes]|uniref:Dihydrolipoamide acetyltransferase n=1 Tax=Actinoplanes ianthinogenes TaxID=122358 RepID=A0ABM7M8P1_9ACTN|nr:alpha/beta fold hydrolase [Actinoplanes ianthinogenes]BCJ48024.1 dihydrolipoamide acetyltransferase [Actinoplanes ianthinogenes]GGR05837.1 dihydrolipoamide acetyltransferase [Actinoplanes ianthinogenes]
MTTTLDVNDVTIAYRTAGVAGNPPAVLLHGLGDSAADWDTVLPDLAATHFVYAVDLRGHGASSHPGKYSFELMRDDVLAFLDAAGIPPCLLIGHSMGGTVAALLAIEAPHRVTHLVLEDSSVPRPGSLPRPPLPTPAEPAPFDFAAVNQIRAQLNDPDPAWWQALASLRVPTLIISGAESAIPHELLADSADRIPDAVLVSVTAGHNVHVEQPTAFVTEIHRFLHPA